MPRIDVVNGESRAARKATSASRHFPACSSSIARIGIPGCACACSTAGASATPHAIEMANAALRLLRIDALEVIEHEAPLLRRQPAEIIPVRRCEPRGSLSVRCSVRRKEQLRARRRLRLALPIVLALVALERPSRIEHAAEQALLTVDDVRIDAAA